MTVQVDLNDANSLFPSNYFKASDFPVPRTLIIQGLVMADMGDGKQKPTLNFAGESQAWVLNKINTSTLIAAYGAHVPAWIGKPVQLFSQQVNGPQGVVPGIRCLIPAPEQPAQPAVSPVAAAPAVPAPVQPAAAPVQPAGTFTGEELQTDLTP